jgi:hypothetical protein
MNEIVLFENKNTKIIYIMVEYIITLLTTF